MPAAAERKLTLEEFHARYDGEKPYVEYWNGEAVAKAMPTRLHSLVQLVLVQLLFGLGFDAGQEITIKLVPQYQPVPDVIADESSLGSPYPTSAFEVAIEILSPDDSFSRVHRKCKLYADWGIRQIVVVDPKDRAIWTFDGTGLRESNIVARRGDHAITADALWTEVDRLLQRQGC